MYTYICIRTYLYVHQKYDMCIRRIRTYVYNICIRVNICINMFVCDICGYMWIYVDVFELNWYCPRGRRTQQRSTIDQFKGTWYIFTFASEHSLEPQVETQPCAWFEWFCFVMLCFLLCVFCFVLYSVIQKESLIVCFILYYTKRELECMVLQCKKSCVHTYDITWKRLRLVGFLKW